jgi:protein SCO1/2
MATPPPDYVPPPWLEWIRRNIWAISFVLGAIAITALYPFTRRIPDPPPKLYPLPSYELVDHRGEPFTDQTLQGKVWVAGFVFTSCKSTCPAVTGSMKELRARFDRNNLPIEMVSFTVDPEVDTVKVLADYVESSDAENERWRFVTGEPRAVEALVAEGFKLGVGDRIDKEGGLYDIAHSTKLALVDETGAVRGYYSTDAEGLGELFERADRVYMETKRRPPLFERLAGEGD